MVTKLVFGEFIIFLFWELEGAHFFPERCKKTLPGLFLCIISARNTFTMMTAKIAKMQFFQTGGHFFGFAELLSGRKSSYDLTF